MKAQRFCSLECRDTSGRVSIRCKQCKTSFVVQRQYANTRQFCGHACANQFRSEANTAPERFWQWVDRKTPTECWLWIRRISSAGYGVYRRTYAHRTAWQIEHGQRIPLGLVIRHTCDNPPCCNPAHLVIGTHRDNGRDMIQRGRSHQRMPQGSAHPLARHTEAEILDIRARAANGETYASLARTYNMTPVGIRSIVLRKTWRHC